MRAHSSVRRHRHDAELQSISAHVDPGLRWNRHATSSRSLHPEPRVRPSTVLECLVSPPEEPVDAAGLAGLVDAVGLTAFHFRSTAAAYGAPTAYVTSPKPPSPPSPPSLLSEQSRGAGYTLLECRDNNYNRGEGNRYTNFDARRSSLGYHSPLSVPPPSSSDSGHSRGAATIIATEGAAHHRSSSRFGERSRTSVMARTLSPLPARLGTVTVAGASMRAKPLDPASPATAPPSAYLIPPPQPQDVGKLVVVLDLDETLVYSRDITLYERPGVSQLLKTLKGKCELIVWTAGTREYALDVIRIIDRVCAVQHCIYRHPMWWSGDAGCTKDLRMLGRPMDRVILIDNTPSVFSANPRNSLLVSDFVVPLPRLYDAQEKVLPTLADIFDHVFRRFAQPRLADVLASKRITRQIAYLERGNAIELNALVVRKAAESGWASSTRASRARYGK